MIAKEIYKELREFVYLLRTQTGEDLDAAMLSLPAYMNYFADHATGEEREAFLSLANCEDPGIARECLGRLMPVEQNPRLFIDMDGTLAVFQKVDTLETLYEEGYFRNLPPIENVVEAVRIFVRENPETEVYIMSSVLSDSKYALAEKNAWLDQYLPEIDPDHRIFPTCGDNKLDFVPDGIRPDDHLLDDYTHNLTLWEPPARGIKLLNGINHTRGTWQGCRIGYDRTPEEISANIAAILDGTPIAENLKVKPLNTPKI